MEGGAFNLCCCILGAATCGSLRHKSDRLSHMTYFLE